MKKMIKTVLPVLLVLLLLLAQTTPAFAASGRWMKSGSRWWYRHADSSYTADNWEKISGKWYHFDKKGWMQTGWLKTGGKWYYLNKSGDMRTGWLKTGGKWYYLEKSGAMLTGWKTLQYRVYEYYTDEKGVKHYTGESLKGEGQFYFDKNGVMATGIKWVDGDLYCFDEEYGWMYTHYYADGYYFTASGKAAVGWYGRCYYYADRTRARDTWIDGKYLDVYGYYCPNTGIDFDYDINWVSMFYENPQKPGSGQRMSLVSDNMADFAPLIDFFLRLEETDREVTHETVLNYTRAIYVFTFRRIDASSGREEIFVYPEAGIAYCEGVNYEIDVAALNEVLGSLELH